MVYTILSRNHLCKCNLDDLFCCYKQILTISSNTSCRTYMLEPEGSSHFLKVFLEQSWIENAWFGLSLLATNVVWSRCLWFCLWKLLKSFSFIFNPRPSPMQQLLMNCIKIALAAVTLDMSPGIMDEFAYHIKYAIHPGRDILRIFNNFDIFFTVNFLWFYV